MSIVRVTEGSLGPRDRLELEEMGHTIVENPTLIKRLVGAVVGGVIGDRLQHAGLPVAKAYLDLGQPRDVVKVSVPSGQRTGHAPATARHAMDSGVIDDVEASAGASGDEIRVQAAGPIVVSQVGPGEKIKNLAGAIVGAVTGYNYAEVGRQTGITSGSEETSSVQKLLAEGRRAKVDAEEAKAAKEEKTRVAAEKKANDELKQIEQQAEAAQKLADIKLETEAKRASAAEKQLMTRGIMAAIFLAFLIMVRTMF